jgi:hypothetical protein
LTSRPARLHRAAIATASANVTFAPSGARQAMESYIRAKDGNRPYLLDSAFTETATLEMVVHAGTLSFPAVSVGRDRIGEVLVRQFAQRHENVHTYCLAAPPEGELRRFSCDWLVGMSDRDNRAVRVGCGRYDWLFEPASPRRVERLTITIERMESLAPSTLAAVMGWLAGLPYPWCTTQAAVAAMPDLDELHPIRTRLGGRAAGLPAAAAPPR